MCDARNSRPLTRHPIARFAWSAWSTFALACGAPEAPPAKTSNPVAIAVPAPAAPSPWRYTPALAAAIPTGTHAEPVLELADGLHGRARIVVAVAIAEAPARLEIWDFSQNNDKALLARIGPPQVLLTLAASPADTGWDRDAAAALRREIAGPGNEAVRPLGLVGEAAALLPELARLAAASTQGDAPTRARALAHFTRGLDERLLLERLPELLRRLQGPAWTIDRPVDLGPRRVKISARDGEHNLEFELIRTQLGGGHGWMITDFRELSGAQPSSAAAAPAADPSPTAP